MSMPNIEKSLEAVEFVDISKKWKGSVLARRW
jgi:hypothetical protein